MICERILGNIEEESFADATVGRELDTIDVSWQECAKRFARKQSRAKRDVGLLLPVGARLRHGDVVYATARVVIQVSVIPCDVFGIAADEIALAKIAYELGDRHWPVELGEDGLVVPADETSEAFLEERGISYVRESRRFHPYSAVREARVSADFEIRRH